MKQVFSVVALALLLVACTGDGSGSGKGTSSLDTQMDSIAYAMSSFYVEELGNLGLKASPDQLLAGLEHGKTDAADPNDMGMQMAMMQFQQALGARQGAPFTEGEELPFSMDTVCYAIASGFSGQMKEYNMDIPADAFYQGAADQVAGTESMVGAKAETLRNSLNDMIMAKVEEEAKVGSQEEIAKGEAFIAEKAQDPNVKSTDSGLHYEVLKAGTGAQPSATDRVNVHYHGTLIDGTVFDSSVDRGEPISFGLNQVIAGWTEGVQLMKEGAKYRFYIPYDLAYGLRGSPPNIPGGATLIFDVELIKIEG
ncbi:MAG: FKBP-type peptidyl-prolyl cis-trans isomerase [Bacteroidota bacterium]